ncbi:MAG TPA: hypothetical protein VF712_04965 [Thermoleophilaceae bacterium]
MTGAAALDRGSGIRRARPDPMTGAAALAEAAGLPLRAGRHPHVRLEAETVQRAALEELGGRVMLMVWPGALKAQALAFYRGSRALDAVRGALARGWLVEPRPHLGFFMASRPQRLYLTPRLDALAYARQWSEGDVEQVGGWPVESLRTGLFPWLVERGYAAPADAAGLPRFERLAARRGPHLRASMRFARECDPGDPAELRAHLDEVLALLGERPLPR